MKETLYRIPREGKIFGVCAGLADYFYVDVTLIRILFIVAFFASGGFVALLYVTMAIVLPVRAHFSNNSHERKSSFSFTDKIQELGNEAQKNNVVLRFRNYFGISLMVFGTILLLDQFIPDIFILRWKFLWPIFLIAVGVMIITRNGRGRGK